MTDFEKRRRRMVTTQLAARGIRDPAVLEAMREVPREKFVPKRHQADFGAVSTNEKIDLALALGSTLKRFHDQLNDPDYNYVIHSAARYKAGEPHLHWYLQIQPRLTTQAGFEIGTGMRINPSLPEDDARFLREEIEGMEES